MLIPTDDKTILSWKINIIFDAANYRFKSEISRFHASPLNLQTEGSDGKKVAGRGPCHATSDGSGEGEVGGERSVDKICLSLSLRLTHSPI